MGRRERISLIRDIENSRKSKLIIYFLGDRPLAITQIADDVLRPMYEHLRALEYRASPKKLDLYLYSRGGVMETPWKIVTMLREFCDELHVIIPFKAYSAATMIAMGTDKMWMTSKAELGPIDPSLQIAGRSEKETQLMLPEIGVEDVASYLTFLKERAGLTDQEALAQSIGILAQNLTAPLLGRLERVYSHIRLIARKLLSLCQPPIDDTRVTNIIETLTEKSYVHGHSIGRKEAKTIGLQVEYVDGDDSELVWNLFKDYEEELKLTSMPDARAYFSDSGPDTYEEPNIIAGCIESEVLLHAYEGQFRLRRQRKAPPQLALNINLPINLPPNIQLNQLPQQVQATIQQLLQQSAQQLQQQVAQEIARQSPIERIEGGLMGGNWILK